VVSVCTSRQIRDAVQPAHPASLAAHTQAKWCSACSPGTDGGLLFGRVGEEDAVTVEIAFPDGAGTLTTPVADSDFFPPTKDGGPIVSFVPERVAAISLADFDTKGTRIASGAR
jgi:hypothetical protein